MAATQGPAGCALAADDACLRFNEQDLADFCALTERERRSSSDLGSLGVLLRDGSLSLIEGKADDSLGATPASDASTAAALDAFRAPSAAEQHQAVARILHEHGVELAQRSSGSSSGPAPVYLAPSPLLMGFPLHATPAAPSPREGAQSPFQREKGQNVSHSTVEKQRRDRINSLIDELRDLVPAQKATVTACPVGKDASAESRRPKHVVLADTITLLKQWRMAMQHGFALPIAQPLQPALLPAASSAVPVPMTVVADVEPEIKKDPSPTTWPVGVAQTTLTINIPVNLNSFAGVTVQRGEEPGMMYVQVKCRDRQYLLYDLVHALRILPVEVRTAAVLTFADGTVRDVFEVRSHDPSLEAETVQNAVHEALYHQLSVKAEEGAGSAKRQKA